MNLLSAAYGHAARMRRRWYERHPAARRRLDVPVVSIGNLVAGGSGKTPAAAAVAAMLAAAGERPAILSRGYARRHAADRVVVVSDGVRVLEPVERSGDEPQLLARALPGIPLVVCADRYRAGRAAIDRFGSTVLVLDDGFQHLALERAVDLLLVSKDDVREHVLPAGMLREPLASARAADALIVAGTDADAREVSATLGVPTVFRAVRRYQPLRPVSASPAAPDVPPGARVVAVAGIARPQRFFAALRELGWEVVRELAFPDHHWFGARDLARIETAARDAGAAAIVTTEKDAMRLGPRVSDIRWAYLPMQLTIEPHEAFESWIAGRIAAARRHARSVPK